MGIITKALIAGLISTTILLGIASYLLKKEVEDHAQTQVLLHLSEQTLDGYVSAIALMTKDRIRMTDKFNNSQSEYSSAIRELNGLKDREAVVLAKKGLVTIKINKAYNKQQMGLACLTGDNSACGK